MQKTTRPRLALPSETVRALALPDLARVAGGVSVRCTERTQSICVEAGCVPP